jgi:3D (Asp-Asp-Asp) domain-containing protein
MEREKSADCYIEIKNVGVEMVESAEADPGCARFNKIGLFTAYTSRKRETDGSPFITADGTDLRKVDYCVVANNHLCFDTVIEVEQLGRCLVKDRMGRGRHNKFDVYFGTNIKLAKEFGVKRLKYKVIE